MEKELYFTAGKSKIVWGVFQRLVRYFVLFFLGSSFVLVAYMILMALLFDDKNVSGFSCVVCILFVFFVLALPVVVGRGIYRYCKAFVSLNGQKLSIRTPQGKYYELDIVEDNLYQSIALKRDTFYTTSSRVYAICFHVDEKLVSIPLDWLNQKERHEIFYAIRTMNNSWVKALGVSFPVKYQVLKKKIITQFRVISLFELLGRIIVCFFIVMAISSVLCTNGVDGNLVNLIIGVLWVIAFLKPVLSMIVLPKIRNRIPTNFEMNERGFCFDEREILYEEMTLVSICCLENRSDCYSIVISTPEQERSYIIGTNQIFVETICNENYYPDVPYREIHISHICEWYLQKNNVHYYIM
ncbi:MAG: hypothetical protein Q4D65_04805 [Peptostreptococcaceae bacterium]|nr:hypothetical protein [Peptostreptococcaceae bacterium]